MNDIEMLLNEGLWPCINALTYGNGRMVLFDFNFYGEQKYYFAPVTDSHIHSFLSYGKDNCTHIDYGVTCETSDYRVYAGEGAFEDEGVVWVLDKEGELIWFYFFRDLAAFDALYVEDEIVCVSVGSDYGNTRTVFKIPIKSPLDLKISWIDEK